MSHSFLTSLALVFSVAGLTTLLFQRLRLPVIFGYLLAGFILGPHTTMIPLVADEETVRTFAELGVILLMFSLGLEFTLRKLMKVGPAAGGIAIGETSAMMWLGYLLGRVLGWTMIESIYAGVIVAISSTTVILKAFDEQGIKERFTRLVFGVLIVEDLIAIFALTILTTLSRGGGVTAGTMMGAAQNLVLFLAGLLGVGLLVVPRVFRMIIRLDRPETTLVASVGLCFGCALLALEFGYSVALGAFIGGSLVAESGHGHQIQQLVQPVRDMFGAMFFVAVGMLIDPQVIMAHLGAVIAMALVVIIGKTVFVTTMAMLTGQSVRTSVQTGLTLAQIGEFSFIIATLGLTLGATGDFLYPVAVAVSAITTLTTPALIGASGRAAAWADRKLPHRIQTFVTLYATWFDRMRHSAVPATVSPERRLGRRALLLLLDAVLLVTLILGTVFQIDRATAMVVHLTMLHPDVARWGIIVAVVFAVAFLCVSILRVTLALSTELARRAFPPPVQGRLDFASAPRGAMIVALRIAMIVVLGLPLVAITQPFIPLFRGSALLILVLGALAIAFWRSVANLEGHARAGAEVILMALSRQMTEDDDESGVSSAQLERIRQALPGLGEPVAIRMTPESAAVGRSLAQLNLRGTTGATVLAIGRGGEDVLLPGGREVLTARDTLFVAGTQSAVAAARRLLVPSA